MHIEKRGEVEYLIGAPYECDGCDDAVEDGGPCCHHLNGEHLAVASPGRDGACEILARWPMTAEQLAHFAQAVAQSDAQRMIDAIHVINSATFGAGTEPPEDAPAQIVDLYRWTRWMDPAALRMRDYQRRGISSRDVAKALECGALVVRIEEER